MNTISVVVFISVTFVICAAFAWYLE